MPNIIALLLCFACGTAAAAEVSLVGVIGGKAAVVVLDGGNPKTVKVGQTWNGITVVSVDKDGPAELAGLGKGDVILEVANTPVKTTQELDEKLKGMEAGSIVWIKADVAGKVETLKVTLEKKR